MSKFFGVLVLLVVAVGALAWYRQWFTVSTASESKNTDIHVTVDKDKIAEDKAKAKEKFEEIGDKIKSTTSGLSNKLKKSANTETKEEYKQRAQAALDELNQKIDDLKAKAKDAGAAATAQFDREELESKRDAAQRKLTELKDAASETWKTAKDRMEQALEDLKKAYERSREPKKTAEVKS